MNDIRHGSAFDRGSADCYYRRPRNPHYYVGDSYNSVKLEQVDMSEKEIAEYNAGFDHQIEIGDFKDYR